MLLGINCRTFLRSATGVWPPSMVVSGRILPLKSEMSHCLKRALSISVK